MTVRKTGDSRKTKPLRARALEREQERAKKAAAAAGNKVAHPPLSARVVAEQRGIHVWTSSKHGHRTARGVYRASPVARIGLIKQGVPASLVASTAELLHMPQERLVDALGLSRSTVARKAKANDTLSTEHGERLVGMLRIIGQVAEMVDADEGEHFDAGAWIAEWIQTPLAALGGCRPAEFMDTVEGQQLVAQTLSRIESGAYG